MSNVMPESMFRHDDSLPLRIAKIIQPAAYAEVGEKGFSAFKAWKKERQPELDALAHRIIAEMIAAGWSHPEMKPAEMMAPGPMPSESPAPRSARAILAPEPPPAPPKLDPNAAEDWEA